eukprot:TRINITY_DN8584_c0_g1_i1.p1 TRINITY_DN8584_c0_g1~~TRINITY_DN8584_c0_g1_i1.p1  ORF type:complete len:329 (-),score=58.63 TRINITY_DN8584_c0_g1_i1:76-1062(-)
MKAVRAVPPSISEVSTSQRRWFIQTTELGILPHDQIRIRIVLAGLCRTDIQSMTGQRTVVPGRILGHEAAGIVEDIGSKIKDEAADKGIQVGSRVAFFPFLPCGNCEACKTSDRIDHCWYLKAAGLDRDGAFATFIDLPIRVVYLADPRLSWEALAYAEPVSAALSALDVEQYIKPNQSLGLLGQGRIAFLTERILKKVGGRSVTTIDENTPNNSLDALIETRATEETLRRAIEVLKPGGILFAKSRPAGTVPWPHQLIIHKRLKVIGLHYGDFAKGLEFMADGTLDVSDCYGPVLDFTEEGIQRALDLESSGQETMGKIFFRIGTIF